MQAVALDVIHVCIVCGFRRQKRKPDLPGLSGSFQLLMVSAPYMQSFLLNEIEILDLSKKKRRQDIRRQEGRTHVDPSILIDFSPEESSAVSTFFPDHLCAFDKVRIIDDQ